MHFFLPRESNLQTQNDLLDDPCKNASISLPPTLIFSANQWTKPVLRIFALLRIFGLLATFLEQRSIGNRKHIHTIMSLKRKHVQPNKAHGSLSNQSGTILFMQSKVIPVSRSGTRTSYENIKQPRIWTQKHLENRQIKLTCIFCAGNIRGTNSERIQGTLDTHAPGEKGGAGVGGW